MSQTFSYIDPENTNNRDLGAANVDPIVAYTHVDVLDDNSLEKMIIMQTLLIYMAYKWKKRSTTPTCAGNLMWMNTQMTTRCQIWCLSKKFNKKSGIT